MSIFQNGQPKQYKTRNKIITVNIVTGLLSNDDKHKLNIKDYNLMIVDVPNI
jgi:hypothetical protein